MWRAGSSRSAAGGTCISPSGLWARRWDWGCATSVLPRAEGSPSGSLVGMQALHFVARTTLALGQRQSRAERSASPPKSPPLSHLEQLEELQAQMQQLQAQLQAGSQGLDAARSVPSRMHLADFLVSGSFENQGIAPWGSGMGPTVPPTPPKRLLQPEQHLGGIARLKVRQRDRSVLEHVSSSIYAPW